MGHYQILAPLPPDKLAGVIEYVNTRIILKVQRMTSFKPQRSVWIMITPDIHKPDLGMFLKHTQNGTLYNIACSPNGLGVPTVRVKQSSCC